ncbi:SDR family oxidoreductase [Salinicoccus sp. ID82-1]|uniref:SDR family oxidoreductase n=1 Tax=Salinicoccus sp. ID82-1 TaxID=2820269 RepID=UPI001F2A4FB5|nr:SDR family oxidoreductase [Salinicoccus sp. ID82-1]MCG1010732.1 SDR family oxidoreductase [Salinicoccus sp. ID82-1]
MKKRILITGVSRPQGIGSTLSRRFSESGYEVFVHGNSEYDKSMEYPDAGTSAPLTEIRRLQDSDLSTRAGIGQLIDELKQHTPINHLVLCHAYSTQCDIDHWSFEEITAHMTTNVTASMLLIQAFYKQFQEEVGCITLFTSGQNLGPMTDEMPYAASKAAVANLAVQTSHALGKQGIRVNAVNPGPTDTGYIEKDSELYTHIAGQFNSKRWGTAEDAANLVLFLHGDEGRWITGQIIDSEGGFRR